MTLEVETVVAVSLMMAVFSAVAAVGTSIILGAGFERLRSGFEVIRKQTGFFSDALHKLEEKVEDVDKQAGQVSESMRIMDAKVNNVSEQANLFSDTVGKLEKKVEVVDKQTGFFSDAIQQLEKKVDTVSVHENTLADKMEQHANTDLISTVKTEALVSHAENLLTQMESLADRMQAQSVPDMPDHDLNFSMPKNLMHFIHAKEDGEEVRYH